MNRNNRRLGGRFFKSPYGTNIAFAGLFVRHFGVSGPAGYWRCSGVIWSYDRDDQKIIKCGRRWSFVEQRFGYFVARSATLVKVSHRIIGDWTSLIGVQKKMDSYRTVSSIFDDGHFFAEAYCIDAGYWIFSSSDLELAESLAMETNSVVAEPGFVEYIWETATETERNK